MSENHYPPVPRQLVEQLHGFCYCADVAHGGGSCIPCNAADEIERLRGIINSARDYCDKYMKPCEDLLPPGGPYNAAIWHLRNGILKCSPPEPKEHP